MMSLFGSLLLCILFMSGDLGSSCIEKERQALLDVKANLTGLDESIYDWGSNEEKMDCCKWLGVFCSDLTGHVTYLSIGGSGSTGKISPSLQLLNQLQFLDLSYNNFQSNPLPDFLGSLSKLERLLMSSANLGGSIPHQLANLSNLLVLNLNNNSLRGSIPFFFKDLTSLTYIDLSSNGLSGNIPNSLGQLSNLEILDVSYNSVNGSIPDFIGSPPIWSLDMSHNQLHGNVPNSLGQLSNLEHLDLSYNSLEGSIPNFIGSIPLWHLDMSSNQLHGNVPNSLGQLSNLTHLDFSSNSLEGVISEVHFLNLTSLGYLDLSFNSLALDLSFHGIIPSVLETIKLQSCNLGPRFPIWMKTQRNFKHLDISNAGISGSVPNWFWDLPSELEFLNISSNGIEGMIPNMGVIFLGYPGMDLSNNHFEGSVPSLPSRVSALNLSGNKFSGTVSFLCNFDGPLTLLDLSNNSFSGSLPDCWMKFQEKLVVLDLSNNNMSGEIPSSLGTLSNLEALYLRKNAFVGEVPMSLRNCTRLRFVDLGENKLYGVIPEWIGELSKLYVLVLGSNRFYGMLPSKVCWLHNLQVLDLSNNGLSANIPRCFDNFTAMARRSFRDDVFTSHAYSSAIPAKCYFLNGNECPSDPVEEAQFLDNAWVAWKGAKRLFGKSGLSLLKSIDLSRNNLSGKIPNAITGLFELVSLNLSVNKLHGEVPKDMGRLKSLESLDLSRNEFSGHIPWSLAQLNFLSYLDLSFNNLSGRIPIGSQLQRFSYTSYSGNPQLCGPPLTPRCGFVQVAEKKDVKEEDDDSWKLYYMGMGVGFAFGFLGICGALILNHRCRYFVFASLSHMKDWMYVIMVVHFGNLVRKFR
ncbi:putative leucine-rich repeat-containing, plant-type, leucine-rich repeat domain superfamily [Helianthus debilis subsp. tardiflorus]